MITSMSLYAPGISSRNASVLRHSMPAIAASSWARLNVRLALGVVVVRVHRLNGLNRLAEPVLHAVHHAVHHLLAVQQGEVLRPPQVRDVVPELAGVLDQV